MHITLEISPQVEAQIIDLARMEGIDPTSLVEKMIKAYRSAPELSGAKNGGGKTIGELYGHLLGTVSFEPLDLAERDEEYLNASGFGETKNRRDLPV